MTWSRRTRSPSSRGTEESLPGTCELILTSSDAGSTRPGATIVSASGWAGADADWIVAGSVLRRRTKTTAAAAAARRRIEMLNRLIDRSLCTHGCQQLYTIEPLYTIDPCVYSPLAV